MDYEMRYVGGLEAVEVDHQVVGKGDVVTVDGDRAADMADTGDWEPVDDKKPRRSKAVREAAAEVVTSPPPAHEGG